MPCLLSILGRKYTTLSLKIISHNDSSVLKRLRSFPHTLATTTLLDLALFGSAAASSGDAHLLARRLLEKYKHLGGLLQAGFDELHGQEGMDLDTTIQL